MANARERLPAARMALDAGFRSTAISAAYYAMFYAAFVAGLERVVVKTRMSAFWG